MFVCLSVGLSLFVTGFKLAPVGNYKIEMTVQVLKCTNCYYSVTGRFSTNF